MKKKTQRILSILIVAILVVTGLWYLLFAPRESSYDPDENRNLAAAPELTLENFWNGNLSTELENWLLDRFWGRGAAMRISQAIKEAGSIATFEDSLAVIGREDDMLAGDELDQSELDQMVQDFLPGPAQPQATEPSATQSAEGGLTGTEPAPSVSAGPVIKPPADPNDYPGELSIISSADGSVIRHKTYSRTSVLAVTSVLSRVAELLPEGGSLVYTMVPQSNVGNQYKNGYRKDYFTSETETVVHDFSPNNVTALSAADILDTCMKNGEYVYFLSDMHWTPEGTYAVYREMAAAAGQAPTAWEDFNITVEEPFLGTYYRDNPTSFMKNNPDSLTLVSPKFDLEWRRITGKDTYKLIPLLDDNARANDRYTVYLGGPAGPWTYAESDNGKEENCLVITDSFGLAFVPMVATNYRQTHYLDPRYYDYSVVGYTVAEMIENYNITDVYVVVGDLHSYASGFLTNQLASQLGD